MPASVRPETSRENAIGFLRLVLAALVIYSHAHILGAFSSEPLIRWTDGRVALGPLAVHFFFALSGYLVAGSFRHSSSVWSYLWKRALRLLPGLWVCLVLTAFVFTPLVRWLHGDAGISAHRLLPAQIDYVLHNLLQPRTHMNVAGFPSLAIPYPGEWNGSLWTLFFEGACYAIVAGLGVLTLLGRRAWLGLALILGFLALHVAWRLEPALLPAPVGRLFNTPGKFETLHFLGGVAWCLAPRIVTRQLARPTVVALAAAVLVSSWYSGADLWVSPLLIPPILFALADRLPFTAWEKRLGGDYSYGVYIYGMPAQQCLASLGVHRLGLAAYLAAGLFTALALAWLSWHLVEGPALRLKSLPRLRLRPLAAVAIPPS